MIIDMHNHTSRYSECSRISPDELVNIYINKGIDGLCITEHDYLWPVEEQHNLQEKYSGKIKIFFGVEASTDIGHVLIFSKNSKYPVNISTFDDIINLKSNEYALIWAHPFRWGFSRKKTSEINYKVFDAIEYYNGNLSRDEFEKTKKRLHGKGYKLTGGSDTHTSEMSLQFATEFKNEINNNNDLVNNIKKGIYKPVKLF